MWYAEIQMKWHGIPALIPIADPMWYAHAHGGQSGWKLFLVHNV